MFQMFKKTLNVSSIIVEHIKTVDVETSNDSHDPKNLTPCMSTGNIIDSVVYM